MTYKWSNASNFTLVVKKIKIRIRIQQDPNSDFLSEYGSFIETGIPVSIKLPDSDPV